MKLPSVFVFLCALLAVSNAQVTDSDLVPDFGFDPDSDLVPLEEAFSQVATKGEEAVSDVVGEVLQELNDGAVATMGLSSEEAEQLEAKPLKLEQLPEKEPALVSAVQTMVEQLPLDKILKQRPDVRPDEKAPFQERIEDSQIPPEVLAVSDLLDSLFKQPATVIIPEETPMQRGPFVPQMFGRKYGPFGRPFQPARDPFSDFFPASFTTLPTELFGASPMEFFASPMEFFQISPFGDRSERIDSMDMMDLVDCDGMDVMGPGYSVEMSFELPETEAGKKNPEMLKAANFNTETPVVLKSQAQDTDLSANVTDMCFLVVLVSVLMSLIVSCCCCRAGEQEVAPNEITFIVDEKQVNAYTPLTTEEVPEERGYQAPVIEPMEFENPIKSSAS